MSNDNDKTEMLNPEFGEKTVAMDTDEHKPSSLATSGSTILSATELEKFKTQVPEKDADKTVVLDQQKSSTLKTSDDDQGTVLSSTEVDNFKTQQQNLDPDATSILDSETDRDATQIVSDRPQKPGATEATILTGGTQAVHTALAPSPYDTRVGIGSVIKDRFTLEKLLGRGGMGEVYLATDKRKLEAQDKNPHIAIKVLGENFKRHPQAFIALQREARKTQELAHPNIVTVYDFDRQNDTIYITMEAMSGKPMDEEIRSEARPLEEAVNMIHQCALGLAYAHKKDLVHSDLKPGNIFITEESIVKLLDFGIARAFKSGQDLKDDGSGKNDTVFDAGELGALTPAYASLEMIEGADPHPSDDVYALGLIAYELLTGKHPFKKQMATKALEQGLSPEPVKGLTKKQWQAIAGALAFKREDRVQSSQAFLDIFTAKSKTPLYVAAVFISAAFIGVASISFFVEPKIGPKIPFEELPVATQKSISSYLNEADIALQFNDFNAALQLLEDAYQLHPYNSKVMLKLDTVVEKLLKFMASLDTKTQQKQLESVLKYESLTNNKTLIEYKDTFK